MTAAQPEAREVPAWRPEEGPMRTTSWPRGGPVLEVYAEGTWRQAHVVQREDRRAGTVYAVNIILPTVSATSTCHRWYAWDAHTMRPVRAATADPIQRRHP